MYTYYGHLHNNPITFQDIAIVKQTTTLQKEKERVNKNRRRKKKEKNHSLRIKTFLLY